MPRTDPLAAPDSDPRIRVLNPGAPDTDGRCVLLWMQRAQRGRDNAALNHAIALGKALKLPVVAGFGLTADYPGAHRRHYRFLVEGLVDAAADLEAKKVPLVVRLGSPDAVIAKLASEVRPAVVVGDENPIRVACGWRDRVAEAVKVPFHVVDADVVVPSALFPKQEYAARTLRPKIHKVLGQYLQPIDNPRSAVAWAGSSGAPKGEDIAVDGLMKKLRVGGVGEVEGYVGGSEEAKRRLARFLRQRLRRYAADRNEPTPYLTSELSAHLHFGHINPLTIALAVRDSEGGDENINAYLEELIVRRELAVNFVARNPDYDRLAGCQEWGLKTLAKHADDRRPVLYTEAQLEAGETGDDLWNASQLEMVRTGRMHNFLRMYWIKKILEWSPDAETAFDVAVRLNDTYEMDGRDPNSYAGIAWGIGGKHDRPWGERPIFGTVRFMSHDSSRRKIDADSYIARVNGLDPGAPAASGRTGKNSRRSS